MPITSWSGTTTGLLMVPEETTISDEPSKSLEELSRVERTLSVSIVPLESLIRKLKYFFLKNMIFHFNFPENY